MLGGGPRTRNGERREAQNGAANRSSSVQAFADHTDNLYLAPGASYASTGPRAETIAAANALLVDHQAGMPLVRAWGGGRLASVDGMRFRVPVRAVNAAPNPKYFGRGRDITYLNFVSDQATGFHAIVVPGTLRDSLYVLDGLLEQNTALEPL